MTTKFYDPGEQRALKVNALFSQIARRYDLVNDLQSLGLHRRWKRRTAKLAGLKPGQKALDLCCGTGDISIALAGCGAEVVGLDFTAEMLSLAQQRCREEGREEKGDGRGKKGEGRYGKVWFIRGDAERLPFRDDSFDAVTVGYGLRNQASVKTAIFDENFVGMHAGDNHSRQIDAGSLAFQRLRIGARPKCRRLYGNPCGIQKHKVRAVTYQGKNEIIL